jgi:hypothetical protein
MHASSLEGLSSPMKAVLGSAHRAFDRGQREILASNYIV